MIGEEILRCLSTYSLPFLQRGCPEVPTICKARKSIALVIVSVVLICFKLLLINRRNGTGGEKGRQKRLYHFHVVNLPSNGMFNLSLSAKMLLSHFLQYHMP